MLLFLLSSAKGDLSFICFCHGLLYFVILFLFKMVLIKLQGPLLHFQSLVCMYWLMFLDANATIFKLSLLILKKKI